MASLFNASLCKVNSDTFVSLLSWSNVDQIAAISTYTSTDDENEKEIFQVQFINIEGEIIPNTAITHDAEAMCLDWQPNGKILCIGWADGLISCWNVDGRNRPTSTFSNSVQHNTAITVLKWNPYGKRIISGDKRGVLCVWAVDPRGTLTAIRQYIKKGEISSAAFCISSSTSITKPIKNSKDSPSPPFFFGTDRGAVIYADDLGHCTDVQQLSSSIDSMLFWEEKSRLVIITRSLLLTQYHVADNGRVTRAMQVKLSVAGDVADRGLKYVVWASPGVVAAATHEKLVRLLDLGADESYNLSLSAIVNSDVVIDRSDRVISVAFSPIDRYLAVGTQCGVIAIWKYNGPIRDVSGSRSSVQATSASDWELYYVTVLQSPIHHLVWHAGQGMLGAIIDDGTVVFTETIMKAGVCGTLAVIQTSSKKVMVTSNNQDRWVQDTGILVKGISASSSAFVCWGGKSAIAYRLDVQLNKLDVCGEQFPTTAKSMVIGDTFHISEDIIVIAENSYLKICNLSGVQKASISFSETEGNPEYLDLNGKYLAAITTKGCIKIFDVGTPTKPKALGTPGYFLSANDKGNSTSKNSLKSSPGKVSIKSNTDNSNLSSLLLVVRSIKVNCNGTKVAILADHVEGVLQVRHPDSKLHIYDRYEGSLYHYDFYDVRRRPSSIFWDAADDRMIACEATRTQTASSAAATSAKDTLTKNSTTALSDEAMTEVEVFLFFATVDHGLLMQDSFQRLPPYGSMVGFTVPKLYFRSDSSNSGSDDSSKMYTKVMRDFIGIKDVDETITLALLDFSYNLTLGKLDEAYRAVKTIGSSTIWENMAHMCVKTKRLDVAEVCLGHMGHARGAAAVRESKVLYPNDTETSIGILAIQLGLLDDSVRLFREAGRHDLLNQLYQASGYWSKAIDISESSDRIHLKNTHYKYAKHFESIGDVANAIKHYEISDNSTTEVPRMLFSLGKIDELEDYVHKSDDAKLLKWWAAYLESNGKYDKARKYYKKSGDYLSLVRIACFQGDITRASDIVNQTSINDKGATIDLRAASYHFARQLENQGQYQDAINYYAQSGCYNHSIRIARAYGLDAELMKFALKSTTSLMLDCAQHFELKGEPEKAIQLYHKGGDVSKALSLCFENDKLSKNSTIFDMINAIVNDLGAASSPAILAKCADFLMANKQYDKAVELYIQAKKISLAIDMCLHHKVPINDAMIEKMTPTDDIPADERKNLLKDLGKALKKQGIFTQASKKYTQAGDRVRAIKCLVRSGDTAAVIQYASISRTNEIYTLAANYLQQMNWRDSIDIMKSIVTFYTKAKAFEQLAGFYDSCAQVEIDEYRDYDKAIGAMKEALKQLLKAVPQTRQIENLGSSLEKRILLIEKFIQARRCAVQGEGDTMVAICESLLQEPLLEEAVRSGDCLSMLIEYFYSKGKMRDAYTYIQEMDSRRIPINPYIDSKILEEIYKAVGVSLHNSKTGDESKSNKNSSSGNINKSKGNSSNSNSNFDDEDIDEDIDEEIEIDEDYSPVTARNNGRPKSAAVRK